MISYDLFTQAFLDKITEYDLVGLDDYLTEEIIDGYMKRAMSLSTFKKVCNKFVGKSNDDMREFDSDIDEDELCELVDIVSEGMVVQWLKPYLHNQEILENHINTRDYTTFSPEKILLRVGGAHGQALKNYIQMIREYSYNYGDLTVLHI